MQRQWIRKKSCPDTKSCKNAVTFVISGYSVFYEGEREDPFGQIVN